MARNLWTPCIAVAGSKSIRTPARLNAAGFKRLTPLLGQMTAHFVSLNSSSGVSGPCYRSELNLLSLQSYRCLSSFRSSLLPYSFQLLFPLSSLLTACSYFTILSSCLYLFLPSSVSAFLLSSVVFVYSTCCCGVLPFMYIQMHCVSPQALARKPWPLCYPTTRAVHMQRLKNVVLFAAGNKKKKRRSPQTERISVNPK